eukprot:424254-Amphidinium_carterae.2
MKATICNQPANGMASGKLARCVDLHSFLSELQQGSERRGGSLIKYKLLLALHCCVGAAHGQCVDERLALRCGGSSATLGFSVPPLAGSVAGALLYFLAPCTVMITAA